MKMLALWVISLVPWAFIDESNVDTLRWALRCFPILRIPEFVCGIALALRVRRDKVMLLFPTWLDAHDVDRTN